MTQNTEQNVRTREEQVEALSKAIGPEKIFSLLAEGYQQEIRERALAHVQEAEARGAEEQRRKDAEGQTVQVPSEGPLLIVFQEDGIKPELFAGCGARAGAYERFENLKSSYHCRLYAAIGSSMKHDHDNKALLKPANVAALEAENAALKEAEQLARADAEASKARVEVLEKALLAAVSALEQVTDGERGGYNARNGKFVSLQMSDGERADIIHSDVTTECEGALETARAALKREGGV